MIKRVCVRVIKRVRVSTFLKRDRESAHVSATFLKRERKRDLERERLRE